LIGRYRAYGPQRCRVYRSTNTPTGVGEIKFYIVYLDRIGSVATLKKIQKKLVGPIKTPKKTQGHISIDLAKISGKNPTFPLRNPLFPKKNSNFQPFSAINLLLIPYFKPKTLK